MANISVNNSGTIEFKNLTDGLKSEDAPTLTAQAGDWNNGNYVESGVTFDVVGEQLPLLSANDARKLAKWLIRAADDLEGKKNRDNKKASRRREEDDDENQYYIR